VRKELISLFFVVVVAYTNNGLVRVCFVVKVRTRISFSVSQNELLSFLCNNKIEK